MTEQTGQDHRQDYFDEVELRLRQAIRRGEHLRSPSRLASTVRLTSRLLPSTGRLASTVRPTSRLLPSTGRLASTVRPSSRLPSRPFAFALAGVAAVAIAAAIVFTVGLGAGTQGAFAGWSAHPTPPTHEQVRATEIICSPSLNRHLRRVIRLLERHAGGHRHSPNVHMFEGPWRTAAYDTRGPYTLVVLTASRQREETCFTGGRNSAKVGDFGLGRISSAPLQPRRIGDTTGGGVIVSRHAWLKYAVGRVGSEVRGVTLELEGGRKVITSTRKGWFLAWWPGHELPLAAKVKTTSGSYVQRPFYSRTPARHD